MLQLPLLKRRNNWSKVRWTSRIIKVHLYQDSPRKRIKKSWSWWMKMKKSPSVITSIKFLRVPSKRPLSKKPKTSRKTK